MGLLFVAGVMNLLWIVVIAAYILVEKIVPAGHWLGSVAGLALIGWGAWIVVGALA
jgi:predicted metal-binding membrane protein